MSIITPIKKMQVFGKCVSFSNEEQKQYRQEGLELNSDILEFFLMSNGIFELSNNISEEDVHDLCVKAINNYKKAGDIALEIVSKSPDVWEAMP